MLGRYAVKYCSFFSLLSCLVCLTVSSNALAQNSSDPNATLGLDVMQLLQQHDAEKQNSESSTQFSFMAPTPPETFTDDVARHMLDTGAQSHRGVQVRDDPLQPAQRDPYFEGTFKPIQHPYLNRTLISYDEGAYAVPGDAVYVGNFHYFGRPTEEWEPFPKGSFVVIGKRIKADGTSENGIYIAEDAVAGFSLRFVRATPEYLKQFEQRHTAAVQSYQQQLAADDDGWDFGQVLALGLGAAMIGSSDLPDMDKLNLAQAFISDVSGDGSGNALANIMSSYSGGGSNLGGLFTGEQSFDAPGLNAILAAAAGQTINTSTTSPSSASPQSTPSGTPSGAQSTAASSSSMQTENFSFSCPMGGNYTIPITYKNPSCGSAMKAFAKTYSCNLIDDFAKVGRQCLQACGNNQCAEVN
jgi:hypothetical protein